MSREKGSGWLTNVMFGAVCLTFAGVLSQAYSGYLKNYEIVTYSPVERRPARVSQVSYNPGTFNEYVTVFTTDSTKYVAAGNDSSSRSVWERFSEGDSAVIDLRHPITFRIKGMGNVVDTVSRRVSGPDVVIGAKKVERSSK